MVIHSFNDVLRAPKEIHSVELSPGGEKIPMWRPIPHIGFLYFLIVWFVFLVAAQVPVLNLLSKSFGPLVYYVAFPFFVVWLMMKVELEGRAPHRWAYSYIMFLTRPKRTLAGKVALAAGTKVTYKGKIKLWWDLAAPRLHHGWVKGGTVTTAVGARFTYVLRHRSPVMRPDKDHTVAIAHPVEKLEIKP